MSYYNELKSKTDIINIAKVLGYNGIKAGNVWQGDCPRHGSGGGKCLVIWSGIQGFKCYHCGEPGCAIQKMRPCHGGQLFGRSLRDVSSVRFPTISPVTTNFRDEDLEKLAWATAGVDAIYIINDNEDNQAGRTGALKTGKYLTGQGRKVFWVELPKP